MRFREDCLWGADEIVVELENGIAYLMLHERSLTMRVAASSTEAADKVHDQIAAALPEAQRDGDDVPVTFWWWSSHVAAASSQPVTGSILGNYVGRDAEALAQLMDWEQSPPGGRLVLWHGAPGTGKTSAVRALAGSWRDWANFHFVTDREQFLMNPSYLLEVLHDDGRRIANDCWRVVVLEDAGEFLQPDAKRAQGQALSRLLNVCDGALGQAMRALILVTTNEPLASLHPALARPGRCR